MIYAMKILENMWMENMRIVIRYVQAARERWTKTNNLKRKCNLTVKRK